MDLLSGKQQQFDDNIVYIITGSTGNPTLRHAVSSVDALVVPDNTRIVHWIVVDGPEHATATNDILHDMPRESSVDRSVMILPVNTGGPTDGQVGYLCHKLLAACFFLVPDDAWVCCLDEDNQYEPDHIVECIRAIRAMDPQPRWAYTLRKVFDDNTVEMTDTVESVGLVKPTCLGPTDRLIDTNCYMFRATLAKQLAPIFGTTKARPPPGHLEADRAVCQTLLQHEPRCGFTRRPTVRYRVGNRNSSSGSVTMDFFKSAQKTNAWDPLKKDLYIFHFNNVRTWQVLNKARNDDDWLKEWCLTLYDGLRHDYNLLDGFECLQSGGLPHDAVCLMTICDPSQLPLGTLRDMKQSTHGEMVRVLYTTEGPNYAHRHQWSKSFLESSCDVLLTYCDFVLNQQASYRAVFMPHNAKFFTSGAQMHENTGDNTGSVAMVLACRDGRQTYNINGFEVTLTCQDWMRQVVAKALGKRMHVVGQGWKDVLPDALLYEPPEGGRQFDTTLPSQTYSKFDYGFVIENCDAVGYVSEKIQDVLVGGAIPIVWLPWLHDEMEGELFATLASGDGVWCVNASASGKPENVCEWLQANGYFEPDTIRRMKAAVADIRDTFCSQRGSDAYAQIITSVTSQHSKGS